MTILNQHHTNSKRFCIQCRNCGNENIYDQPTLACAKCNHQWQEATYDYYHAAQAWQQSLHNRRTSLWRYHELLPLKNLRHTVSMGEGWTPLIKAENLGLMLGHSNIYIKDERQGPTGSFKDRQAAVAVSAMREAGIREAVVASTGNVAIAYSAYCARAGIKLWVFVTSSVPQEKMREAAIYGSEVIKVAGTYDETKQVAAEFAASKNLFLDRGIKAMAAKEAMKTLAFEISEQLGRLQTGLDPYTVYPPTTNWASPDWYLQAVSGGMGPVGVIKGFEELQSMGLINKIPKLGCLQAAGCAPMVHSFKAGLDQAENVFDPDTQITTLATGVPGQAYTVLKNTIDRYGGTMEAVTDSEAFRALKVVAQMDGISIEPATAVTFAGLIKLVRQRVIQPNEMVVINCSGHTFPVEKHILGDQFARDMVLNDESENAKQENRLVTAIEKLDDRVKRIAIVEDNPHAARLIRRILQSQGEYFISEATNGRDALDMMQKNPPHLVILDLMMPEVDGFQVVNQMKNSPLLREIPIIVITAKELSPIEKQQLSGKIKKLLPKGNFMDADLMSDIEQVLG